MHEVNPTRFIAWEEIIVQHNSFKGIGGWALAYTLI
jgi:hypothetical protein